MTLYKFINKTLLYIFHEKKTPVVIPSAHCLHEIISLCFDEQFEMLYVTTSCFSTQEIHIKTDTQQFLFCIEESTFQVTQKYFFIKCYRGVLSSDIMKQNRHFSLIFLRSLTLIALYCLLNQVLN